MNISCPSCSYTRPLSPEICKKQAVIATCPKCGCRFQFSPRDGVATICALSPTKPDEQEKEKTETLEAEATDKALNAGDDPLPQGAIIIPREERSEDKSEPGSESNDAQEEGFRSGFYKQTGANPWERAPGHIGWISSFIQTCLRVMFTAQRFFSQLSADAKIVPPLLFYLLISCLEVLITFGWIQVLQHFLGSTDDAQLNTLLQLLSPKGNVLNVLFVQLGLSVVKIYVLSGLFFCMFRMLSPQTNNFNLIFQVVAYSTAPALLCIVPLVGSLASLIWNLGCLAIGLRCALKISWQQTIVGFLPILLLVGASLSTLMSV